MKNNRRIHFHVTHPLYKKDTYDSWMTLCEHTYELAERHAMVELRNRIEELCMEMLATAEEHETTDNTP